MPLCPDAQKFCGSPSATHLEVDRAMRSDAEEFFDLRMSQKAWSAKNPTSVTHVTASCKLANCGRRPCLDILKGEEAHTFVPAIVQGLDAPPVLALKERKRQM